MNPSLVKMVSERTPIKDTPERPPTKMLSSNNNDPTGQHALEHHGVLPPHVRADAVLALELGGPRDIGPVLIGRLLSDKLTFAREGLEKAYVMFIVQVAQMLEDRFEPEVEEVFT